VRTAADVAGGNVREAEDRKTRYEANQASSRSFLKSDLENLLLK